MSIDLTGRPGGRHPFWMIVSGALIAMTAGCGSHVPGTRAAPARPATSLVITVTAGPGAAPRRWTLTCGPVGGSLPHARAACAALGGGRDPFLPVPPGVMCSQISYGPQRATVTGRWLGAPVSARFSRTDGCQEQRWQRMVAVFGIPSPASTPSGGAAP